MSLTEQLDKIRKSAGLSEGGRITSRESLLIRPVFGGLWFTTNDDGANALAMIALLTWFTEIAESRTPIPTGYTNIGNFFQNAVDPAGRALLDSIRPPRQAEQGMVRFGPAYTDVGGIPWTTTLDGSRPWRNTYQAQDHTLIRTVDAILAYRRECVTRRPGRLSGIDRTLTDLCDTIAIVAHANSALPGNWHYDRTPAQGRAWELPVPFNFEATASGLLVLRMVPPVLPEIDDQRSAYWNNAERTLLRAMDAAEFKPDHWPRFGVWEGGRIVPVYGTPDGTVLREFDEERVQGGYNWMIAEKRPGWGLVKRLRGDAESSEVDTPLDAAGGSGQ